MELPPWAWIIGLTAGPAALLVAIRSLMQDVPRLVRRGSSDIRESEWTEAEAEKFRAAFVGIMKRELPYEPRIASYHPESWGEPTMVHISPDPLIEEKFERVTDVCPVCGVVTESDRRLPATLEPVFSNGLGFDVSVWTHPECLASCPETDIQRGLPW
jgi:hypothetical protein